jgi:hypothetical protein
MRRLYVSCSRGQIKIQQMAFMLVVLVIFFAMVGLVYLAISLANLKERAGALRDEEASKTVQKLSGVPELSFTSASDCSSCVDLDKALLLSERDSYNNFWNLDYLRIEKIYPESPDVECTRGSYPNCKWVTIIDKAAGDVAGTKTAFVSLVRWDPDLGGFRYEFGRIHAGGERIEE